MLFNSFVFLFVFLPLVVTAYFVVPGHRARLVLIVVASYVFYAYAKWWFALLMAASTFIGYAGGRALERNRSKAVLALIVASLLALLGAFKYAAFVGGNLTSFVGVITAHGFPGFCRSGSASTRSRGSPTPSTSTAVTCLRSAIPCATRSSSRSFLT